MSDPRILGGRYELAEQLGRGGMAEVRRAIDTRLGREVAVKLLRIDLAGDSTFQVRFRREAQASAGLNHPNIVSVYDTGEEKDPNTGVSVPYIVMERIRGHTLRDILRDGRKILPSRALEFTQGVLDALSYSHKAGIVHRDIKPANVMLTDSGTIKVMDFGIARAVADTSATMTQTAAVIGTAQYLSPEQARGETVDARSDIYSAGCLMYELLVGHPPFRGDSPVSVAYQHVREHPVPPSQLDPMVSLGMDAIVLKSLAKDPAHRYQTAAAMKADIGRLLAGQAIIAGAPTTAATQVLPQGAPTMAVPAASTASAATAVLPASQPTAPTAPQRALAEQKTPNRRGWLWGLVAFLLVLGLGYGAFLIFNPQAVAQTVAVPNVYDKRIEDARQELTTVGLQVIVNDVAGPDDDTIGRVIKQDPVGGVKVPARSTVTLQVNIGPRKATIPTDLVGQSLDDVQQELNDLGFKDLDAQEDNSDTSAKANEVLSTNPTGGATVTLDTQIVIRYSPGTATVPNFYGLTKAGAEAVAQRDGLRVSFTTQETSELSPGQVFKQDVQAGEVIKRSRVIKLVIAKEPSTDPSTSPSPSPSPSPSESD